jgi:hypothetical protein
VKRRDDAALAEVETVWDQMRAHLSGDELARFDALVAEGRVETARAEDVDVSPLGFWLAIAGAVAMVVAVFLQEASSSTFGRIEHNTLIQSGYGWFFVALALGDLGSMYRAYRLRRSTW